MKCAINVQSRPQNEFDDHRSSGAVDDVHTQLIIYGASSVASLKIVATALDPVPDFVCNLGGSTILWMATTASFEGRRRPFLESGDFHARR